MAIEFAADTRAEFLLIQGQPKAGPYSATAVFDGEQWSALCRELDIASDGLSPMDALVNLQSAVREALAVAEEKGVSPGQRVSDADLKDFIVQHVGPQPVAGLVFYIT